MRPMSARRAARRTGISVDPVAMSVRRAGGSRRNDGGPRRDRGKPCNVRPFLAEAQA